MELYSQRAVLGLLMVGSLVVSIFFLIIAFQPINPAHKNDRGELASYDVQLLEEGCYSTEKEGVSLLGGIRSFTFQQNLTCYMNSEELIVLRMERHDEQITIQEIYNASDAALGISLYNITGTIRGIDEGTYHVTFIFVNTFVNKTSKLYERTVTVTDTRGLLLSSCQMVIPLTIGSTLGIVAIISGLKWRRTRGREKTSNRPSS